MLRKTSLSTLITAGGLALLLTACGGENQPLKEESPVRAKIEIKVDRSSDHQKEDGSTGEELAFSAVIEVPTKIGPKIKLKSRLIGKHSWCFYTWEVNGEFLSNQREPDANLTLGENVLTLRVVDSNSKEATDEKVIELTEAPE